MLESNYSCIDITSLSQKAGLSDAAILSFRPDGERVNTLIIEEIRSLECEKSLVLNYENIEACDVSCADETVLKVMEYITDKNLGSLILYTNFNSQVFENVRGAQLLKQKKLSDKKNKKIDIPFLYLENGSVKIIGDIESNLIDTFNFLTNRSNVTARDVAEANKIAINNASNRLKRLYDYGLILRETITDDTGKYNLYKSI